MKKADLFTIFAVILIALYFGVPRLLGMNAIEESKFQNGDLHTISTAVMRITGTGRITLTDKHGNKMSVFVRDSADARHLLENIFRDK